MEILYGHQRRHLQAKPVAASTVYEFLQCRLVKDYHKAAPASIHWDIGEMGYVLNELARGLAQYTHCL
jgi:hypothetical protein